MRGWEDIGPDRSRTPPRRQAWGGGEASWQGGAWQRSRADRDDRQNGRDHWGDVGGQLREGGCVPAAPWGPPPEAGLPPPYDGAGKGQWSAVDLYLGKGMDPPAYDGVTKGSGRGLGPIEAYFGMSGPPLSMFPAQPPPGVVQGGKGGGYGGRGRGGGGFKDSRQGYRGTLDEPSQDTLDDELARYFQGDGRADNGKGGGEWRWGGDKREATSGKGKRDKVLVDLSSLDSELESYMAGDKENKEREQEAEQPREGVDENTKPSDNKAAEVANVDSNDADQTVVTREEQTV